MRSRQRRCQRGTIMSAVSNDGFGRMTTYSRFAGTVVTEYRTEGYYWAYPIHTSKGGFTAFKGLFPTRNEAKLYEANSLKNKRKSLPPAGLSATMTVVRLSVRRSTRASWRCSIL